MKILLLNDFGTATAGAERITLHLRDGLRSRGHVVRVFTSAAQHIAGESFADARCFGSTSRIATLTSAWNASAARELRREIDTFRPDVVQVHMFLFQLSPSILHVLAAVPSVYYAMTYKAVCPTGVKWLPSGRPCTSPAGVPCMSNGCLNPIRFGAMMLQRHLWRRERGAFDAVVTCSNALRGSLEADGIRVTDVVYPGVPEASGRHGPGPVPTITFAGRLVREKGVDVLLRAFALVRQGMPEVRLDVAGSGPDLPRLQRLATELRLDGSVRFLGQLQHARLDSMYEASWVHAIPSIWAEPFGITTTEAMMRGVAVVGSDTGGITESIDPGVTGYRVPPGDAPALADALRSVLASPALARELGVQGRRRALAHFGISACVTRFEAIFERIVARQGEYLAPLVGAAS